MVHACAAYGCNNRYQEDLPWCRIEKITWKFYITKPSVSGSINVYVKPDYNLYMHTHSCVFISFTAATTLPNLFTCHQFFGRCWDHQLTFADFAGTNNEVNKVHPVVRGQTFHLTCMTATGERRILINNVECPSDKLRLISPCQWVDLKCHFLRFSFGYRSANRPDIDIQCGQSYWRHTRREVHFRSHNMLFKNFANNYNR